MLFACVVVLCAIVTGLALVTVMRRRATSDLASTRMEVAFVGVLEGSWQPVVLLLDLPGRLCLPVPVTWLEAEAVRNSHAGHLVPTSGPGRRLQRVVLGTPTAPPAGRGAELVQRHGARVPSDPGIAIVLAVRAGAPIEVTPSALSEAIPVHRVLTVDGEPHPAFAHPDPVERDVAALRRELDGACADDFAET